MPQFSSTIEVPRPTHVVFDYLAHPANLVQLAPAEMRLELVRAPDRLQLGSVIHWKARRMGVSQTLVNEVTAFEEAVLINEEQKQGPFKRWAFLHRFEATADGTRLTEELTCEPPGGLLGMLVTAEVIQRELEKLFAYRAQQFREIFCK
jgi:ligand-binding SRPBCC domain-containing protein